MNQRLLACSSLTDIPRILLRIGGLKLEKSAHWFRTRRLLTQDSNLFLICANLAPRGDPAGVRIGPNSGDPAGADPGAAQERWTRKGAWVSKQGY